MGGDVIPQIYRRIINNLSFRNYYCRKHRPKAENISSGVFIIKHDYRYQILSIPFSLLDNDSGDNFSLSLSADEEKQYLIEHNDSPFDDQIRRIDSDSLVVDDIKKIVFVPQVILVEAKKNKKAEQHIRNLIAFGFEYNGRFYKRYGKSASQGKAGITLFVDEKIYDPLFEASTLGLPPEKCVTSKYESQRCLTLSTCTLIRRDIPYIVIIDEYTKIMPNQYIRYVVEEEKTFTDKATGEERKYKARVIKEGTHDIKLSPFDGCGCHDESMSKIWSEEIGLDYVAVGYQIRLPFFKGYSVEVPFKQYYRELGVKYITDIFGRQHEVEKIDCIWNTSMWKASGVYSKAYGASGWDEYVKALKKYEYKLGISKYSHHKKDLNLKARMNFQYLQCLDLENKKYVESFYDSSTPRLNLLDQNNWGPMIQLASYTTDLFENICNGNRFYSMMFLGIMDTEAQAANGKYIEAVLLNDAMLKDSCIQRYIYRKAAKGIEQAKYGKIYASGFYHTVVGDMIGYLEYASGRSPEGCLNAGEFFCLTLPQGKVLSLRSPLVCPSEVNSVKIVSNEHTDKWFKRFQDQDVVMLNMYDLSFPQQGGMDADGDAVFLCNDPVLVDKKIDKPIIIDVEDKAMAAAKPYTLENIVNYEMATRDNRIGEITNVATSILNQYTNNEEYKKINEDNVSLLRIFQGKEIDYLKTGVRWTMNKSLRSFSARLPYFLMYNYPKKMGLYKKLVSSRRAGKSHIALNAYHSPSPMNELCDYIETWEKKNIVWKNTSVDTRYLTLDHSLDTTDLKKKRAILRIINEYSDSIKELVRQKNLAKLNDEETAAWNSKIDLLYIEAKDKMLAVEANEKHCANYAIDAVYSHANQNQSFVWKVFGDIILENIKSNTPERRRTRIVEVPYKTDETFEFLGKYYELFCGVL